MAKIPRVRTADLENNRKKALGEIAKGIEIFDLDSWVPEPKVGSDVTKPITIKEEEDEDKPQDKALSDTPKESTENANQQSIEMTAQNDVSGMPTKNSTGQPEASMEAQKANTGTTSLSRIEGDHEQGPLPQSPLSDPMDVDKPESDESGRVASMVATHSQAPQAAMNDKKVTRKTGAPHVGRKPIERLHSDEFRETLRAKQREAAKVIAARSMQGQKGLEGGKVAKTAKVSAKPAAPKSKRALKSFQLSASENGALHAGRMQDPNALLKTQTTGKQRTASGGGYPSDHDSSDGDDDQSGEDEGLFVPESAKRPNGANDHNHHKDVDMDAEFDEADFEKAEEEEFKALEKKLKKTRKEMRKKQKKGEEPSAEEEVVAMQLEHEYERAVQKRRRAMEDDEPAQNNMFAGIGGGDVDDDDVEEFEDPGGRVRTPPATGRLVGYESEEDDDLMAFWDSQAKANQANTGKRRKSGGDISGDELVGTRKKRISTRRPRQKKTGAGGRKKKPATTNITGDGVQDPHARVQKTNKSKRATSGSAPATQMLNMQSLLTGDVIRDSRGNAGLAALPGLTSKDRGKALNALVASLPPEHRINARTDKRSLLSAMKDFRRGRSIRVVVGEENSYHIPDMTSHLRPHQLLGSAFMRRRETDTVQPQGGICADQMGLGKTVMMIANILDGRPTPKEGGPRTTIIVATTALCIQWKKEITKHTQQDRKDKLKVLSYTQRSFKTSDPVTDIQAFDIVLTTYDEVRKSYPKAEFPIEMQTAEEKQTWWKEYYEVNRGDLHKVEFLRVVLDEAHQIKNHRSHTSIGCRGLSAKHRWALSGTPIQNSVKELYPYFKFLRVEHTGSYKVFCQNFVGNEKIPSKLGLNRLNQLLNRFMIRRTHADKVMGAPIVILPRASEQIRWVKFNDVERSIYEIVRSRMIKRINKLSRSKELDANYSHVLTMLLRLRQLTGHILLVETAMRDLLETEDHEKIYELAMMENTDVKTSLRTMQLKQVRYLLAKGAKDEGSHPGRTRFPGVQERERRRDSVDPRNNQEGRREAEEDILPERDNIGGKHGIEYDFLKYLDTLREANNLEELNDRTTCVYCGDSPTDPHVTSCFHIYCEGCLENLVEESGMADQDRARCRDCGSEFVSSRACHQMDSDPVKRKRAARSNAMEELEESDSDDEMLKHHRRWRRKNDNKRKEDWIDQEGKNILPSAKTIEIKAQVLNWIAEHPHVKIIIFTQFINMIRILQKVCSAEGWAYTLYHGGINMTKRQENIDKFASEPNVRILLASLKAGGIGLNLTMAQKVIVVDPWWNSSVEQQAFCRVFRMGQEHETSLTRFVVENTVDQNMIEMQRRKQEEIDQVMDTKKSCGKRLEINELLALFGNEVSEDQDGQPFIIVKNQETRPNPMAGDEDIGDSE